MDSILSFLSSAAGGGIFGSVLHVFTGIFETKRKRAEAEIDILKLKAQAELQDKAAAAQAFAESQKGSNGGAIDVAALPPWVAACYGLVGVVRDVTRPMLTWALLGVLVYVYSKATPEVRSAITGELTFGAFTAIFWWFGSRYSKGAVR